MEKTPIYRESLMEKTNTLASHQFTGPKEALLSFVSEPSCLSVMLTVFPVLLSSIE